MSNIPHKAAIERARAQAAGSTDDQIAARLDGDADELEASGMAYAPTMMREAAFRLRAHAARSKAQPTDKQSYVDA